MIKIIEIKGGVIDSGYPFSEDKLQSPFYKQEQMLEINKCFITEVTDRNISFKCICVLRKKVPYGPHLAPVHWGNVWTKEKQFTFSKGSIEGFLVERAVH